MKRLLGHVARVMRKLGLGGALGGLRDALDAALLRLGAPVLHASVADRRISGFLRHRSFLAEVDAADYEPSLRQLIQESVEAGGDVLFVDIGAHVGYYSVVAASLGADVIAVEPDPYNNAALRKNVRGLPVDVRAAAVSDRVGHATFHPSASTIGSSLLARRDVPMRATVDVPTTTVDELVAGRFDRRIVVKIDVEGAEPLALAGAAELLRRGESIVVVAEVNPSALAAGGYALEDVLRPLQDAGCEIVFVDRGGAVGPVPATTVKGNLVARRAG